MTRIRIITMALAAMFCLSAVSASGAFAAAKKGELVNKEGNALVKNKFTATGGEQKLETKSGANVKCSSGTATGTVTSKTEAAQNVVFKGCKNSLGQKCKTEGAAEEEIKLGEAKALLGFLVGSAKEKLAVKSSVATTFKFLCSTVTNEAKGAFVVAVGAAQEGVLKTKYEFTAKQTKGVQEFTEFETVGGVVETGVKLEAKLLTKEAAFEQAGQAGTETVTLEEEAKVV